MPRRGIQIHDGHGLKHSVDVRRLRRQSDTDRRGLGEAGSDKQSGNDTQFRVHLTDDFHARLRSGTGIVRSDHGSSVHCGRVDLVAGYLQRGCGGSCAACDQGDDHVAFLIERGREVSVCDQCRASCFDHEVCAKHTLDRDLRLHIGNRILRLRNSGLVGSRIEDVDVNDRADLEQVVGDVHGLAKGIILKIRKIPELLHCLLCGIRQDGRVYDCGRIIYHVDRSGSDHDLHTRATGDRSSNGSAFLIDKYSMLAHALFPPLSVSALV